MQQLAIQLTMRCKACDVLLAEHELKRKGTFTGEYMDLCDHCYETIQDDMDVGEDLEVLEMETFFNEDKV